MVDDGDMLVCARMFSFIKISCLFLCLFIFSRVYFRMKRLDLCFSNQRLAGPNARRILRHLFC